MYDASGNMVRRREYETQNPSHAYNDEIFVVASTHNRLQQRYFADNPGVGRNYLYDAAGNRLSEQPFCPDCNPDQNFGRRDFWYDGLSRTKGTSEYRCDSEDQTTCGLAVWVWNYNTCAYDPVGRNISGCDNVNPVTLGMDGSNVTRTHWDQHPTAWTLVHGPGIDDPILSRRPDQGWTVYSVTDGRGRELAVARSEGYPFTSELYYAQGAKFAGAAGKANTFGIERYKNPEMYKLSFFRNRFYDQTTGRWTQEDPIGYAGGINLYGYVGNNPVSFSDPFGLCKKDKDGNDDPNCLKLISELEGAAAESEKAKGKGAGSTFRDAVGVLQRTDREVRFVPASHWVANRDGDPTTFAMGQTVGTRGPILIASGLGGGDRVLTAAHEALTHVENNDANSLGMHFGDMLPATNARDRTAFNQLPAGLLPTAELWRRKLGL